MSTSQVLSPVVVGANVTCTVPSIPALTRTGIVGETIWNWLQSAPPCSTIVTVTSVPPVATSVSGSIEDCPTVTLPKSSGLGDSVKAARAAPLPPNQTPSSNNQSQYLDIAMLPSRDDEQPCRNHRRDYNANVDGEKRPELTERCNTPRRPISAHIAPSTAD